MDFYSCYAHGFARVAACTVPVAIADPATNAATVLEQARACHDDGVAVAVFPELCLTGYSIDDLFLQDAVLDAVLAAVDTLVAASAELRPVLVVGAPLRHRGRLYNCAVAIHDGQILGVAPKSYLPTYREFYEARHFAAGADEYDGHVTLGGREVPFGRNLLFRATDLPDLTLFAEICEDMWVPVPPAAHAALAGATVIANLSGSPITVGRERDRRLLVQAASNRYLAAYLYAAGGQGESTTDLSWDGETTIFECGTELGRSERFPDEPRRTTVDVDLDRIRQERLRQGTFDDNRRAEGIDDQAFRVVEFTLDPPTGDIGLRRVVRRFPFVPDDAGQLAHDCFEAYNIQVAGLVQRLRAIDQPKVVLGLSGGLDSTQAMLVAIEAMDRLGRPRTDVLAYTLPGFATSAATKSRAARLAQCFGVSFAEIDIRPAANRMLDDLDHPFSRGEEVYDTTFENVQAGLRTDYLFRLANRYGGIVLGTGDMSELALGWCTYGVGDQMSHYNVNSGVPKTLIQHLIRWVVASSKFGAEDSEVGRVLTEVVEQEISPELIPQGEAAAPQSTEAAIGPYALQDFTLFHVLRHGFRPSKIAFMARHAWADVDRGDWPEGYPQEQRTSYDLETIRHWLEVFCKRFFGFSQFKRSAMPDGPKVTAGGSLSPRGDWRMPSDATAKAWLASLERVPKS